MRKYVSNKNLLEPDNMSKHNFDSNDKKNILKSTVVTKVSDSTIGFTAEFKESVALAESLENAIKLFEDNGLSSNMVGVKIIQNCYYRWTAKYKKIGISAFSNERRGRKPQLNTESFNNMTDAEKVRYLEKQLIERNKEVDFLKKYMPSLQKSQIRNRDYFESIYNVKCNDGTVNVSYYIRTFNLIECSYYKYVKRIENSTKRDLEDMRILADIQFMHKLRNHNLGYRQMTMAINTAYEIYGYDIVNHKRIQRLMQSNRIYCKIRKINPYKLIWKATKEDKISPNLLKRKFKDGSPFEIILTDITYLHCKFGTVYLSAAKDSITNEIVAFKIQDNMRISLSTSIINQLVQLPLHKNVKVHSDQGVHYSAKIFRNSLKINNITQSISKRGNCWDNAPMESFFGHFKDEVAYQK